MAKAQKMDGKISRLNVPSNFRPADVIRTKRDGGRLSPEQIAFAIRGFTEGTFPDYAMSALLMSIFLNGMGKKELEDWTQEMLHSGSVLDLSDIPGAKIDKHSTGGVGDKISIPLAPLVAAAGVRVPMVSGRGLAHTGGTLDKLESIPGFNVNLDVREYRRLVRRVGACLIGQTPEIAPADKRIYALRDVTATVASIPLISSSIMSKKLAEGIDGLVLDVKVGSGAFMKDLGSATKLARTMVQVGQGMGKEMVAVLSDMNQPLGWAIGNALEIDESIQVLRGGGPPDVVHLTVELGAWMLVLGKKARTLPAGRKKIQACIAEGSGLKKFREIVGAQGGDVAVVDDPSRLPRAKQTIALLAPRAGFVTAMDTEAVGVAAMELGAGRARLEDDIDPAVGILLKAKTGDRLAKGDPLAVLYVNDSQNLSSAKERLLAAYTLGPRKPRAIPLIRKTIRGTR